MRVLPLVSFALCLCAVPSSAFACWDSETAVAGPVCISLGLHEGDNGFDHVWDERAALAYLTWAARMRSILPPGAELDVHLGEYSACADGGVSEEAGDVTLCNGKGGSCVTAHGEGGLEASFDAAALLAGVDPARAARARSMEVRVWTVQLLAARAPANASALDSRVAESGAAASDFVFSGHPGYPLYSTVVEGPDGIHRVIAGAFLDRAEAESVRAAFDAELGVRAFVRPLAPLLPRREP